MKFIIVKNITMLTALVLAVLSLSCSNSKPVEPTKEESITTFELTFGGTGADRGYAVIETSAGGFVITGNASPPLGTGPIVVLHREYPNLLHIDSEGKMVWEEKFDYPSSDPMRLIDVQCKSVVETSDGGFILTGWTFTQGNDYEVLIIKTNSSGAFLWEKTFGGEGTDRGYSICETSDSGYVITGIHGELNEGFPIIYPDVYLIKLDKNGNLLWEKTFGRIPDESGYSVIESSDGGLVIVGEINTSQTGDNFDVYLIKTDSDGIIH